MRNYYLTAALAALLLAGACADFPQKYNNVIDDGKIRPFAVILDKPEAAPGDTVNVELYYHDAGRNPSITWKLALDCTFSNYSGIPVEDGIRDLDALALPGGTPVRFSFVVPAGSDNPLLLNDMVPDTVAPLGAKRDVLAALDADPSAPVPAEYAPYMDALAAIVVLRATVVEGDLVLDVTKRLTVRYSSRVATGSGTNVNTNPVLPRFGIAAVSGKDANVTDDREAVLNAAVRYFTSDGTTVDTFTVDGAHTYFLVADTAGAAQWYKTPPSPDHPAGQLKLEELYYDWFYTNLDETGAEWDELIELGDGTDANTIFMVRLNLPEDHSMHNFRIRSVCRDYRPEFGIMNALGAAYLEGRGYFEYR